MPQPTPRQVHVDRFLTNLSVSFAQSRSAFVADQVFPIVPVQKQSDLYAVYPRGFFNRDQMRVRPLGGRAQVAGYEVAQQQYRAEEWALAHPIDDRVRANADQPLDPDRAAMRFLTSQCLIRRDRLWGSSYFTTGKWSTDLTGVAADPDATEFLQLDQSGSAPIRLFKEKKAAVRGDTGLTPNTLVLGSQAFLELTEHDDVLDRIEHTSRQVVTRDILASLIFDDDPSGRVIVAGGIVNSAVEGADDDHDYILGSKDALLVYRNPEPRPTIEEVSGGYTFAWTGLLPGETNAFGGVIERMRDDQAHSDHIEIRAAFDLGMVAADLGVFFDALVP